MYVCEIEQNIHCITVLLQLHRYSTDLIQVHCCVAVYSTELTRTAYTYWVTVRFCTVDLYCQLQYKRTVLCCYCYWYSIPVPVQVLYCTVLVQYTILYCTVLYCTVLYCTVLYCTILYYTVLYCTVLYCTVLLLYYYYNILYYYYTITTKYYTITRTTPHVHLCVCVPSLLGCSIEVGYPTNQVAKHILSKLHFLCRKALRNNNTATRLPLYSAVCHYTRVTKTATVLL